MNYEKMYYQLAAKVSDAVEILITAQQQGEQQYIEEGENKPNLTVVKKEEKEDE